MKIYLRCRAFTRGAAYLPAVPVIRLITNDRGVPLPENFCYPQQHHYVYCVHTKFHGPSCHTFGVVTK